LVFKVVKDYRVFKEASEAKGLKALRVFKA
jgi:hypothetical protein